MPRFRDDEKRPEGTKETKGRKGRKEEPKEAPKRERPFYCEIPAGPLGEAHEFSAVGFTARLLVLATLPHKNPGEATVFGRENGDLSLLIQAGSYLRGGQVKSLGLPYGSLPRVLLCWMTREALLKKSRVLLLGPSLSAFMAELGLVPTGGRWGSIPRLREQMQRLFGASLSYIEKGKRGFLQESVRVAQRSRLFWNDYDNVRDLSNYTEAASHFFLPQEAEKAGRWRSFVTLGEEFFQEITRRPVPLDLRVVKLLSRSPLSLDIYCWLTYRVSYLDRLVKIPWQKLELQFGADYGRTIDFKINFAKRLKDVLELYPNVQVEVSERGLHLSPSRPHVLPRLGARERREEGALSEEKELSYLETNISFDREPEGGAET
jgi:hypothetical protein